MKLIRLIILITTIIYSYGVAAEKIRCNVDVKDVNTVDRRLKSLGCEKGDVLYAQFWLQPDGTFPSNESPSTVAAKNCDFSKQILIEKESLKIQEEIKEVYTLSCILDEYHAAVSHKSEK